MSFNTFRAGFWRSIFDELSVQVAWNVYDLQYN